MAKDEGLYFPCPSCGKRFAEIEETDGDLFAGETYHARCCGAPVVLVALSTEMLASPETVRRHKPVAVAGEAVGAADIIALAS